MTRDRRVPKLVLAFALTLLALGLVARVAPICGSDREMLQSFPTEDAYLMMTIARNMAIGNGMSIADGTIPTNGTQPLTTFEWAAAFWVADGDKATGVRIALFAELITSLLACFLLYRLGRRLFADNDHGASVAAIAASAWFASPLCVSHSMNCLETGNYALLTIATFAALLGAARPESAGWSWPRMLGTGVLLGATFWTRNDAVFLILAACLVYLTRAGHLQVDEMRRRLPRTLVMGATSVVVALPWLIHNQANFGSIMPVSGHAEAYGATLGSNLYMVASMMFEYVTIVGQIPGQLQTGRLDVELASLVGLLVFAAFAASRFRRGGASARSLVFMLAVFAGCLVLFYGLWFGAPHFVSRYFFPVSPILALLTVDGLATAWRAARERGATWPGPVAIGAAVVTVGLAAALNWRRYDRSIPHMHFQVVDWIDANVPEDAWIGAPQTGTIGFFHDRTINLDGKVDPTAYEHVVARTIPTYVVEKDLQFLADWHGLVDTWKDLPPLDVEFEVLVNDAERNLSVLGRKGARTK